MKAVSKCQEYSTHIHCNNIRIYIGITWNRKNGFIVVPSRKKTVQKNRSYRKPCNPQWGPGWSCETNLGQLKVSCWPSLSPPLPWLTLLICRGSYIYWVLRNNSSVHNVAVTRSYDTLVLTSLSSSSSATSSPFFFLPWERVIWTFFRLSLC
jgi:hypothetical protein